MGRGFSKSRIVKVILVGVACAVSMSCIALPLLSQNPEKGVSASGVWQPKAYGFDRYQGMIKKHPFGKVPAKLLAQKKLGAELPPEKVDLAIAGVSVIEGESVVYLINTKTKTYQKVDTYGENENKIRLLEVSDAHYPRDVEVEVLISGRPVTLSYDKKRMVVAGALQQTKRRKQSREAQYSGNHHREDPEEMERLEQAALEAMEKNIARAESMTEAERMAEEKEIEREALAAMAMQADRDGYEVPWAKEVLGRKKD